MTNRECLKRLASNSHDVSARNSLYENNAAVIDESLKEFFGDTDDKTRSRLLTRLADRCRIYPREEDADHWIETSIEVETARLYKAMTSEKERAATA